MRETTHIYLCLWQSSLECLKHSLCLPRALLCSVHWNIPLAQNKPNIVVAEGSGLSHKCHWYLSLSYFTLSSQNVKGKWPRKRIWNRQQQFWIKQGFSCKILVFLQLVLIDFRGNYYSVLIVEEKEGGNWLHFSFENSFITLFLEPFLKNWMKIGHHLLDLVDLVGASPDNRRVQGICQAINRSSIPTRAGMTIFMEITGWYLKSSAKGCWYSTGDGAWGRKNFIRGKKIVKKSCFTKHPGGGWHETYFWGVFIFPCSQEGPLRSRKGRWTNTSEIHVDINPFRVHG